MGKLISIIVIVGIFAAVLIFGGAFYIVNESEQVVITQFGKPVGDPITTPGLKIKTPFLETANYFDKRFLAWDGEPKQVSTRDKRFININTYARWRISDPLQYAKSLSDESRAKNRIGSVLEGATQNAIAKHDLIELVRTTNRDYIVNNEDTNDQSSKEKTVIKSGRDELTREILEIAKSSTSELGIEILDFNLSELIMYPKCGRKYTNVWFQSVSGLQKSFVLRVQESQLELAVKKIETSKKLLQMLTGVLKKSKVRQMQRLLIYTQPPTIKTLHFIVL